MRILRTKNFGKVSEFTEYYRLPISSDIIKTFTSEEIASPFIEIATTNRYNEDFKYQKIAYGSRIKSLIRSIKKGHLYDDGDEELVYTHFIAEASKKGHHVVFTKDIDSTESGRGEHRLSYTIYPITITPVQDEEDPSKVYPILTQKVVLNSCKGHYLYGNRYYSSSDN